MKGWVLALAMLCMNESYADSYKCDATYVTEESGYLEQDLKPIQWTGGASIGAKIKNVDFRVEDRLEDELLKASIAISNTTFHLSGTLKRPSKDKGSHLTFMREDGSQLSIHCFPSN